MERLIAGYLQRLQRYGTSIELTWGEDDNLWTVAWITGGVRFTASKASLDEALGAVWLDAAVFNADRAPARTEEGA